MDDQAIDRLRLLGSLPAVGARSTSQDLRALVTSVNRKIIVLDDDPTGTQTVHDIPVVTRWSIDHLARELTDPAPASYVLTNSRSLDQDQAVALCRQVAVDLRQAAERTGRDFTVISRSDSTLRGHFPAEVEVLESELGQSFDAWILCPFFGEGGRLTIGDLHYLAEGDQLVPAAQTPFARDPVFGYRHSNLRHWIVEKSAGRIGLDRCASLSIEELRHANPDRVQRKLAAMKPGTVCIINSADPRDLEQAVRGLMAAEAQGQRFLYRTAASFVAARAGIAPRPLLASHELEVNHGKGVLIVVGSYVPKTTDQLARLTQARNPSAIELPVKGLLNEERRGRIVAAGSQHVDRVLAADEPVVVYTSRELIGGQRQDSLSTGQRISQALVHLVRCLTVRPRALVGKGGITSSDLATDACGVQRAVVMGQILPGVPVWQCGRESRFPGMPLVVFPGNVGDSDALVKVLDLLQQAAGIP